MPRELSSSEVDKVVEEAKKLRAARSAWTDESWNRLIQRAALSSIGHTLAAGELRQVRKQ
jgi:hypothetical protein